MSAVWAVTRFALRVAGWVALVVLLVVLLMVAMIEHVTGLDLHRRSRRW